MATVAELKSGDILMIPVKDLCLIKSYAMIFILFSNVKVDAPFGKIDHEIVSFISEKLIGLIQQFI
jgi:hypothetical protein